MSRLPAIAIAIAIVLAAQAAAAEESWYRGTLDDRAVLRIREDTRTDAAGTVHTQIETELRLDGVTRDGLRQTASFREDAAGHLLEFRFASPSGAKRSVATGSVDSLPEGRVVRGRAGPGDALRPFSLRIASDPVLVGPFGERAALHGLEEPGDATSYLTLRMRLGAVETVRRTARLVAIDDGVRRVEIEDREGGSAVRVRLDAQGEALERSLELGQHVVTLTWTDRPPALAATKILPLRFAHLGPPPRLRRENRYRLPETLGAFAVSDAFQTASAGIVFARAVAQTDASGPRRHERAVNAGRRANAALRSWVSGVLGREVAQTVSARIEALRASVSERIRTGSAGEFAAAASVVGTGFGACVEGADLLAAALQVAGVHVRVDVGLLYQTTSGFREGHAWNSAYDPEIGTWVHVDSLYADLPRSVYILLGSATSAREVLARTHGLAHLSGTDKIEMLTSLPRGQRRP